MKLLSGFETYYVIIGLQEIYEIHKTKYAVLYERYRVNHNPILKMEYKQEFKKCVGILQLLNSIDVLENDIAIL